MSYFNQGRTSCQVFVMNFTIFLPILRQRSCLPEHVYCRYIDTIDIYLSDLSPCAKIVDMDEILEPVPPKAPLACELDPDRWFPKSPNTIASVKILCNQCPVKDKCLELAIENEEVHGVWGGVDFGNPNERVYSTSELVLCRSKKHMKVRGTDCPGCRKDAYNRYEAKTRRHYTMSSKKRKELRELQSSSSRS